MSKGTKSFGHDKALACESRGFVCKKRGCVVLTHPRHAASWMNNLEFRIKNQADNSQLAFPSAAELRFSILHF